MSDVTKNSCEAPKKHWKCYSKDELRFYLFRNIKKSDCSFVVDDSNKVLKSFQWILKDMSPVLTKILNDKKSEAKNWNLIPISDPNFEKVITFGHTKNLNESFDFYETAIKYQIEALKEYIYGQIPCDEFGSINWINFFRILYMEKDPVWSEKLRQRFHCIFAKVYGKYHSPQFLDSQLKSESNIKMILDFDIETFNEFFTLITTNYRLNSLLCFNVTEAYLTKHVFDRKPPKPSEEQDNITRNFVTSFLENIKLEDITLEEFENGPGKSNLLDENTKSRILNILK